MPISKRIFDLIVASLGLIILSPFILLTAILVRIFLGTPVLFRQTRPGYKGKPFTVYKFRTMTDAHDAQGNLLSDAVRLTRFGKFLRSLSLDELPELFNILRGEMSLIGPRPLLMQYLPLYSSEQMRRHDVHPGVTGWAQVNGRNAIDWPNSFCVGCLVCGSLVFWTGFKNIIHDPFENDSARRHQSAGAGND